MDRAVVVWAQGGKHRQQDKPCQDRAFMLEENGIRAIALSDGAGSSRYTHSEYGAEYVTKTMVYLLCRNFGKLYALQDTASLQKLIHKVCNEKLQEVAQKHELSSVEPLSCTMLAAAQKGNQLLLCHLGDGAIGGMTAQGPIVLSEPENGEYAGTTYFMSMPEGWHHIRVQKMECSELQSVFMMSDGTFDYTFDEENHCFTSGITAMAAMIGEADGKEQLEKTITTYMTLADVRSDDCSFAGMILEKEKSKETAEKAPSRKKGSPATKKTGKNGKKTSSSGASTLKDAKSSARKETQRKSDFSGKTEKKKTEKKKSVKKKYSKREILEISVQVGEISTGLIFLMSLISAVINLIRW